jgi:hypothetical protein
METKRGRPKKDPRERRTIVLEIRVSPDEHETLLRAAESESGLSTWAREALLRSALRRIKR